MKDGQMENTKKITTDIGGWPTCSGASVSLYLVPAEEAADGIPRVYSFGRVGSGTPMLAWNRRHLGLGSVDAESLEKWILARADELVELSDAYQGSEWDGNNHVGRWGFPSDEDPSQHFSDELDRALQGGEIGTYWDAGDWLSPAGTSAYLDRISGPEDIERVAAEEVEEARNGGALIRQEDTEAYLRRLIEGKVLVETMPDHLRASHRAAGNWGVYPHNGAVRRYVDEDEAEEIVEADSVENDGDGYDRVVEPA